MTDPGRPNIFPTFRYRDAQAALEWLARAFGAQEKAVYRREDGVIHHAELRIGAGLVMFGQHREEGWLGGGAPDALASPVGVYITVPDADAMHDQAVAAGATVVRALVDTDYGSREFSVRDLEGNAWSLGTYDPYAEEG